MDNSVSSTSTAPASSVTHGVRKHLCTCGAASVLFARHKEKCAAYSSSNVIERYMEALGDTKKEVSVSALRINGQKKNNFLFWSLLNVYGILGVLSFSKLPSPQDTLTEPFELMVASKIVAHARRLRLIWFYCMAVCAGAFYLVSLCMYGKCFLMGDETFKCSDGGNNLCYLAFLAALTPALSAVFVVYEHIMVLKSRARNASNKIHNGVLAINLVFMITFAVVFLFAVPKGVVYNFEINTNFTILVEPWDPSRIVQPMYCTPLLFYFIACHLGIFCLSTIVTLMLKNYRNTMVGFDTMLH
ncbi:transcriptional regulator-like motif protein [Ranid herpesvirus 3]|uniref:Transcriptional regulator-like motif protein n=1 Tax=Ranid herpesvirus 3 TaxID=1987509 RepID=A0A1X9T5A4_9VIRU|nr:transcriptional regulator-like motif protein [Ranid herpesvirus 3]ARR28882.1 transcriptional regulator-like motif protein [Ranid herpesvirus 3]